MGGEFLRETGVLVFVFFGLAALLSGEPRIRPIAAAISFAVGLSLWCSGVVVERRRSR
jgi:hypothetical protein